MSARERGRERERGQQETEERGRVEEKRMEMRCIEEGGESARFGISFNYKYVLTVCNCLHRMIHYTTQP